MIRWGVLGLGKIAKTFIKEFDFVPNAEISFVASSDPDKAARFASDNKIPQSGNYEDLLNSDLIDVVYIALPHSFHDHYISKCIDAGKHVLCEKPITVNAGQLRPLVEKAEKARLFLMEAMWTLFLPSILHSKKWVDEGRIGKLVSLSAEFAFPASPSSPERLFKPELAGGSLLDIGIYPITLCRYIMGYLPDNFDIQYLMYENSVDASVQISIQYPEAIARLYCSFLHRAHNSAFIYGTQGYIEIPIFWKSKSCILYDNNGTVLETYTDNSPYHGFYYEIMAVNQCLVEMKMQSPQMPLELSLDIIDFMDKVRDKMRLRYPFE